MNRPARVTQAEIARALRAIKQADMPMAIEVTPDGVLRIVPAPEPEPVRRKTGTYTGPVPVL